MSQYKQDMTLADKLVDQPQADVSFREMAARVFLRPRLFLFALLVPPLVAMIFASLIPNAWSASSKILIRYTAADNKLLKNLISEGGLGLSGETTAELITSAPVLKKTIEKVGIKGEDIYKKPSRYLLDLMSQLTASEDDASGSQDKEQETLALINGFKASLVSSSKKSSSDSSVAILDKKSQMPEAMKLDELITIQVKSFNREKVDDMANGLTEAFINEYYHIYQSEAEKQLSYLDKLIANEQQLLGQIEQATPADFSDANAKFSTSGAQLISREVPILNNMANQLSEVESELTRLQQVYAPSSPKIRKLRAQVSRLKFMYKKQERIEVSKQLLEQLNTKHYQAMNTLNIYQNRLVPIDIVERAQQGPGKGSGKLKKIIVNGVIGLVLGLIVALGLTIILNVIDPRVHFRTDLAKLTSTPVISSIPMIERGNLRHALRALSNEVEHYFLPVVSYLGSVVSDDKAKVIVFTGAGSQSGVTFSVLALANTLSRSSNSRVCVIDANSQNPQITKLANQSHSPGLSDALLGEEVVLASVDDAGFDVCGIGTKSLSGVLTHEKTAAADYIEQLKAQYDYIIIDTGSVVQSNDATVLGGMADQLLYVVASGLTRKGMVEAGSERMRQHGIAPSGILFNMSKKVLPEFIYRFL